MNKPCPFCGSTRVTIDYFGQQVSEYWVECKTCGTNGPIALTETMAWDLWNERAEDDNDA